MNKEVKTYIGKRQYAYIYILHKLFNGDTAEFCRAMRISGIYPKDIQEWDSKFCDQVLADIEDDARMAAQLRDADGDIPTVASLKDAMLIRLKQLIRSTEDPSKLATCYRVLSEFGKDSKRSVASKDAASVVMERLQPRDGKRMKVTEAEREKARLHPEKEEEEIY